MLATEIISDMREGVLAMCFARRVSLRNLCVLHIARTVKPIIHPDETAADAELGSTGTYGSSGPAQFNAIETIS